MKKIGMQVVKNKDEEKLTETLGIASGMINMIRILNNEYIIINEGQIKKIWDELNKLTYKDVINNPTEIEKLPKDLKIKLLNRLL